MINRFGRPISVPPGQDHLLVNSYSQSSGVDVALLGFDAVLRRLSGEGIRPLFDLHDALILDVQPDRSKDASSICDVQVPGYAQSFPLKLDRVDI